MSSITAKEIKEKIDLLQHIKREITSVKENSFGDYTQISPCPFCSHNDCFSIEHKEDKKRYTCFSCDEKGSVIDFTMKIHNLAFKEAVEKLAIDYRLNGYSASESVALVPASTSSAALVKKQEKKKQLPAKKEQRDPTHIYYLKRSSDLKEKPVREYLSHRNFRHLEYEAINRLLKDGNIRAFSYKGAESLLVPMFQPKDLVKKEITVDDIFSAQAIRVDHNKINGLKTNKSFFKGSGGKGAFFFNCNTKKIIVVESFANALALACAGYSAISVFASGNVDLVKEIKETFHGNEVLIWFDKGTEKKQMQACRDYLVNGLWWDEKDTNGYDVNDLLSDVGEAFKEEIKKKLLEAQAAPRWIQLEQEKEGAALGSSSPAMPEILVEGGALHSMTNEAENALINSNEGVYQRFGQLVCVSENRINGKVTPFIRAVEKDYLVELFTKIACWRKWKGGKDGNYVDVDCPKQVAQSYMARPYWKVPSLTGVINTPTIRLRNGEIIEKQGLDEESGLLLRASHEGAFSGIGPKIDSLITEHGALEAAKIALVKIQTIFKDFPFQSGIDGVDFSVVLSAVLTALVRFQLRSAPLHGFSAPKMGSGKSLLADIVSLISTGRAAPVISQADDADEEKKRFLAILLEGERVVCIDNIEKPLESAALCTILTQESWRERILGRNSTATVATNSTLWLATGNNLQFKGDLSTRALCCRLSPSVERPEERTFKVNLHEYIPSNREEIVLAGLTILKAFIADGAPKPEKTFGRFEQWSDLIRGSIVWLGLSDPCESRESVEENDPHREGLLQLLESWYGQFLSLAKPVSEVCKVACREIGLHENEDDEAVGKREYLKVALKEVAADKNGGVSSSRLGYYLKTHRDRIEGGLKFVSRGKSKQGVLWAVERIEE